MLIYLLTPERHLRIVEIQKPEYSAEQTKEILEERGFKVLNMEEK